MIILNYIKIISISFSIQLLICSVLLAQTERVNKFENQFFMMDFRNNKYDLSEVEKYFFTTFPHDDPTRGDVVYDRLKWVNNDMIMLSDYDGLYSYVKFRNDGSGFDSFRFTSKSYYNINDSVKKILFVFKGRFPSAKGIWSAWWLNGSRQSEWLYKNNGDSVSDKDLDNYSGAGQFYSTPSPVNSTDWPGAGEIDIVETINADNIIHNTLHTCPQMCNSEWNNSGVVIDCSNAVSGDPNSGCSGLTYKVNQPEGTFACLWEKGAASFYYWPSQDDVGFLGGPLSRSPNPETWNTENLKNHVRFLESDTDCKDEIHKDWQCKNCKGRDKCEFVNLKMIFNVTLCGKWAGDEFDETENSSENCTKYILGEGKDSIENEYLKIEYVSVSSLP